MAEAYWRDSARTPKFFSIDARATFPLLLFLLHIRMWTFIVAVIATLFFATLDRYGFTPVIFLRVVRGVLIGKRKMTAPWWVS